MHRFPSQPLDCTSGEAGLAPQCCITIARVLEQMSSREGLVAMNKAVMLLLHWGSYLQSLNCGGDIITQLSFHIGSQLRHPYFLPPYLWEEHLPKGALPSRKVFVRHWLDCCHMGCFHHGAISFRVVIDIEDFNIILLCIRHCRAFKLQSCAYFRRAIQPSL